ncbi:MAG: biliverdin-producing heme oxygenase [Gemmatimonadota bacterium]
MTYDSTRIMENLKEATAEQHRDAERRQLQRELVRGQLAPETYAAWLGQMFLVHEALWESIAAQRPDHARLGAIVLDDGLHVGHLRADLAAFGLDADDVAPLPSTQRAIQAIEQASESDPLSLLGYNYVLEGSMNGNQYIARALQQAPGISAMSYLDPYGVEQRPSWQAYRERMNDAGFDEPQGQRIVAAAGNMFSFIAEMSDDLMRASVPASRFTE